MRSGRLFLGSALILSLSLPAVAATHHRHHSLRNIHLRRHSGPTGQRSIDDQRATQIQAALVKTGYLTGTQASGHWDTTTQAAMQKFQSDNGWQTKLVPDSRAIIKLGLGPSQDSTATNAPSSSVASTASVGASFLPQ
ncbi:hypothetical protein GCM10011507_05530 [Edaphobacter acidisoli]|uniref:Peptidoglycan binding-like domain-containing protein n=1 Tax=Edaphobacter acidisoli TaxID=2040573 RepID=A0A916W0B7_9BACT|nr:peptidoglycan-binding protein [Edaphobacter acidisoli]GGA57095.1 hypothetical protein GCM10011507_05530 [Edaphobacter acidisoli]